MTQAVGIPAMEFLVTDTASRLGFPLLASATGEPEINNPPTAPVAQPSTYPISPIPDHPFGQLSLDTELHGANSCVIDHQASQHTPIYPPSTTPLYNISHAGYDLVSEGPSASTHMGYISGERTVNVAYQSGIAAPSQNPSPVGPSLRQTLDNLAAFLPTQLPTLRRISFELEGEDASTERALHGEFARINSAPETQSWAGTEFVVVRRGFRS